MLSAFSCERHSDSFSASADDHCVATAGLVAVAVGTDVNSLSVTIFESRNLRPYVLDADGKQKTA